MFDSLRLYFQYRKARAAISKELSMPNGKTVLLNGVKHFVISAGAVAAGGLVAWLSNDTALLGVLASSGVPTAVAIAVVPLAHSVIAMIQKKWFSGVPATPAPPAN